MGFAFDLGPNEKPKSYGTDIKISHVNGWTLTAQDLEAICQHQRSDSKIMARNSRNKK
jgi:hypothetical protein